METLDSGNLVDELERAGELMGDVVMGEGLAGPLALVGFLIIAFSIGIVAVLGIGGALALVRPS